MNNHYHWTIASIAIICIACQLYYLLNSIMRWIAIRSISKAMRIFRRYYWRDLRDKIELYNEDLHEDVDCTRMNMFLMSGKPEESFIENGIDGVLATMSYEAKYGNT